MLQNISIALNDGGYFIATLPNAFELTKRYHLALKGRPEEEERSGPLQFGNSVYTVTFDDTGLQKNDLPLFGTRYLFQLEGVVDCPEFLVYPPLLIKMAEERGMSCVDGPITFDRHFLVNTTADDDRRLVQDMESFRLLSAMNALEVWKPQSGDSRKQSQGPSKDQRGRSRSPISSIQNRLVGVNEKEAYRHVEEWAKQHPRRAQRPVGTISEPEWDVFCMYCTFAFQKIKHS